MSRFRYLHLSDTHFCVEPLRRNAVTLMRRRPRDIIDTVFPQVGLLGFLSLAKPASYVPEIVSGAAQFCLERSNISDGIIVTGDLATTGMMSDIVVARSFISDRATNGFLGDAGFPTLNAGNAIDVLPGNHDNYTDNRGTPNCKHFALNFEQQMQNFENGVGYWVRRKQGKLIGFIYADFTLQSRMDASDRMIAVYGQGRVKDDVLSALKNRTFDLRSRFKDIALVWVIYFAPFDCGYRLHLHNWQAVIDAAITLKVAATLCGHTHRASKSVISEHTVYCAGSAGCVDSERNSQVHIVNFDVDDNACRVSRENFIWDTQQHEYVPAGID